MDDLYTCRFCTFGTPRIMLAWVHSAAHGPWPTAGTLTAANVEKRAAAARRRERAAIAAAIVAGV